jgi:hypothetical protein
VRGRCTRGAGCHFAHTGGQHVAEFRRLELPAEASRPARRDRARQDAEEPRTARADGRANGQTDGRASEWTSGRTNR